MLDNLKEYIKMFFNSRLLPITVVFVLLFSILVNRMFELQIVDRDNIIASGASNTIKEKDIKATRGNIYDCNGKLLAYNKLSYNIVFSETSKLSGMTNDEKNQMIHRLLYILQKHGSELSVEYYLQYEKGKLQYQVEGSSLERYQADAYSVQGGVKALTQEQKDTTPQEMYDYLIKKFEISDSYDQDTAIDILAVRYAMFINRYAKFQDIILAKNVNENTVAAIKENSELLPGVDIDQNTRDPFLQQMIAFLLKLGINRQIQVIPRYRILCGFLGNDPAGSSVYRNLLASLGSPQIFLISAFQT